MVNINDLQDSYNRISKYLVTTPILQSENLNKEFNADIYLKNEVEQLTGSFKIRGALSALSKLKKDGIEGVVAFSLMVTIIWLYLEILRLLAKLRSR